MDILDGAIPKTDINTPATRLVTVPYLTGAIRIPAATFCEYVIDAQDTNLHKHFPSEIWADARDSTRQHETARDSTR